MIKTLKSKLLVSVRNKRINVFLIFLLLAFIILIFSKLSKTYTNTIAFKVEKVNVPEEKIILNNSDSVLNITLKTHGFKWLDFYLKSPKVNIDFAKDVSEIKSKFIWTKSKTKLFNTNQFTSKVEVINMFPDTLVFNYDVNSVKQVPIKLNANIEFSQGFNVFQSYKTFPDSIKVIGPKEEVMSIKEIETETLELQDVKSNINTMVDLKLPSKKSGLKYSNTSVAFKANVERFTEGTVKVPVTLLNVPENMKIKYFPKEVSVIFYTSLDKFKSIKPNHFKVVCDYKKVEEESSFFTPELVKKSKEVKGVKLNNQNIEFIILE